MSNGFSALTFGENRLTRILGLAPDEKGFEFQINARREQAGLRGLLSGIARLRFTRRRSSGKKMTFEYNAIPANGM